MKEPGEGFSFRILAAADALPPGGVDAMHKAVAKGLRRYLADVKAGKFLDASGLITVEELLQTEYHPSLVPPSNVVPFSSRRSPISK